jgi:cobalt-zinc-cadmium efflux system membrane fusion protein
MNKKQKLSIALMCAIAAILAGLMLWRPPGAPPAQEAAEHKEHQDSHGHDDRHADESGAPGDAGDERSIAMTEAQIKANGIAIDTARPAMIQERLHLPAQIKVNAERTVALAAPAQGIVQSILVSPGATVRKGQALVAIQSPAVAQWRRTWAVPGSACTWPGAPTSAKKRCGKSGFPHARTSMRRRRR